MMAESNTVFGLGAVVLRSLTDGKVFTSQFASSWEHMLEFGTVDLGDSSGMTVNSRPGERKVMTKFESLDPSPDFIARYHGARTITAVAPTAGLHIGTVNAVGSATTQAVALVVAVSAGVVATTAPVGTYIATLPASGSALLIESLSESGLAIAPATIFSTAPNIASITDGAGTAVAFSITRNSLAGSIKSTFRGNPPPQEFSGFFATAAPHTVGMLDTITCPRMICQGGAFASERIANRTSTFSFIVANGEYTTEQIVLGLSA